MGNENTGKKIPRTVGHRKRLSDITNTPILLKSRAHDENLQLSSCLAAQLQDELTSLKKVLAEKEEAIEENRRYMEKLWMNYCRKTKQNDEIILHNSQLYKDLMQARDKLKVLQHENTQMSALYKACKLELQQKLNEALEQVDRLTKLVVEASSFEKQTLSDKHANPQTLLEARLLGPYGEMSPAIVDGRSTLRTRKRKSYKEPSLKAKMRQSDGDSLCSEEPVMTQCDKNIAAQGPCKVNERKESGLVTASMSCDTQIETGEMAVDRAAPQPYTGKDLGDAGAGWQIPTTSYVSTRKPCARPLRRAVSSIGSYKEAPLNTKMRRAT